MSKSVLNAQRHRRCGESEGVPGHRHMQLPQVGGTSAGPFADRSGGLISFEAPGEGSARQLISDDPFQRAGLINDWWLKVWLPQ